MKKLLTTFPLVAMAAICYAQTTWNLNFGTNTGTFTIATNSEILSTVSQSPNLDVPKTSEPTQIVRLRRGNDTDPGLFELVNTGTTIGSDSRLKITAPNGTSSNKFSVYNIAATSKIMRASFKVRFDVGTTGEQIFSVGNNDGGAFYSNGSGLTTLGFASMQWNLGATKHAFSFFKNTTSNNSTTAISETLNPVIAGFTPNSEHTIEVYCNNTTSAIQYSRNSANYTVGASKWHIWVNGTQIFSASGVADFDAGVLGADLNLNAFAYNSKSSSATPRAVTYLDDFEYSDFLPAPIPLPVSLTSFTAQKQGNAVHLKWNTASEINNSHFIVQKSIDGINFNDIAKINGAGNSHLSLNYYYTDYKPTNGVSYYRLKQVDYDGQVNLNDPVSIDIGFSELAMEIYPQSSNINIGISSNQTYIAQLSIYDTNGKKILEHTTSLSKGNNVLTVPMPTSAKGIFVTTLRTKNQFLKKKFFR